MTTPNPNIISGKEFAKLACVTASSVSQACKKGPLGAAKVGRHGIDVTHPAAKEYIKRGKRQQREYAAGKKKRGRGSPKVTGKAAPAPEMALAALPPEDVKRILDDLPKDIRELADRSLRELVERFGTAESFVTFLKAIRELERIHKDRLANEETEGTLVSRELVRTGVLEPLDVAHKKLLRDGSKAIATRVVNMAKAGRSVADCKGFVEDHLSSFLRGAKAKAVKAIGEI